MENLRKQIIKYRHSAFLPLSNSGLCEWFRPLTKITKEHELHMKTENHKHYYL